MSDALDRLHSFAVLLQEAFTKLSGTNRYTTHRAVMDTEKRLWPRHKEITYSYMSGNSCQRDKVDKTMLQWTFYSNLTFKRVGSKGNIRISFNDKDTCWSTSGMQASKKPKTKATMNLAGIHPTSTIVTGLEVSYILHEFGHVLGFHHEHQSPSRARMLTFNRENILEHYGNFNWSRKDVEQNFINVLKGSQISSYSAFDTDSIMMYPIEESYNEQEIEIRRNMQLSEFDKAYAMVHYPRQRPHKCAPEWTISHALDVIGVHGVLRDQILRTRNPEKIRDLFTRWNASERSKTV